MAAAIYLHRAGLEPVLIERAAPGGLLRSANLVENYPGFPDGLPGTELVARFVDQLRRAGVRPLKEDVRRIALAPWGFKVSTNASIRRSRSVIVATGTKPTRAALRGAAALRGTVVFDDITDLPGVSGKRVIVVGGGDAAFDYALSLVEGRARAIIISRSEPRCLALLRDRTEAVGIEVVIGANPIAVRRTPAGVTVECDAGASRIELAGDMVLMACGRVPRIEVLSAGLRRRAVDGARALPETGVRGLYLAGDVARERHRQTGIAVGDGIRAAMLAKEYLDEVRE